MQLKSSRTRIECSPTRARLTWTSPIQVRLDYSVGKIRGIIVRVLNAKVEDDKLRLFVAVFANILQPFTQIQQLNGEINPKSKCGCTPFHIAAGLGKVQICEFFLVNVEEKNPVNKNGNTPPTICRDRGPIYCL